ncbi:MAG: hypothetical protein QOH25_3148 [Acidobacteriota bacterium]|jgi:hypothetical protein|nr:hypothetical protein [Acidobacteriota bacterium]
MPLSNLFRRKKADPEIERRARLLQMGRITEGVILDTGNDDSGAIRQIYFHYEVSGVEYESSQLLSDKQQEREADYSPGARVTIRFDPHRPGNSIVV